MPPRKPRPNSKDSARSRGRRGRHAPGGRPAPAKAKASGDEPRIKWQDITASGNETTEEPFKRFYHLETLASATAHHLKQGNHFLAQGLRTALGGARLGSLQFSLVSENSYRLVFRVSAGSVTKKRGQYALAVARNDEEFRKAMEDEAAILGALSAKAPRYVPAFLGAGEIFLPDRYRRRSHDRHLPAYLTQWPGDVRPLAAAGPRQWHILERNPAALSLEQTEMMRTALMELVFLSHDAKARTALDLQALRLEDVGVSRTSRGTLNIKLLGARRLWTRMHPPQLVHRLVQSRWKTPGDETPLAPAEPIHFCTAATRALGKETAQTWIGQYLAAAAGGRVKRPDHAYLEAFEKFVVK